MKYRIGQAKARRFNSPHNTASSNVMFDLLYQTAAKRVSVSAPRYLIPWTSFALNLEVLNNPIYACINVKYFEIKSIIF